MVSSLIAAVALLTVSVVGLTHSFGFAIDAADAAADVGEIAPERAAPTGRAVTAAAPVSSASERPSPATELGASSAAETGASAAPSTGATGSGGAPATADTTASLDGVAGAGALAGAAPTAWENGVKGALALIAQNTISMCGRNTCNTGQVCCNASCGICVAPGESCDQKQCAGAPRTPTAILCGRGQCNDGLVCCNASCGICAAPGETCSQEKCR